jgi:hypothetical protein
VVAVSLTCTCSCSDLRYSIASSSIDALSVCSRNAITRFLLLYCLVYYICKGRALVQCSLRNLVAVRYELLQGSHLLVYPVSSPLQHCWDQTKNIHVRDRRRLFNEATASNKLSSSESHAPAPTGCALRRRGSSAPSSSSAAACAPTSRRTPTPRPAPP